MEESWIRRYLGVGALIPIVRGGRVPYGHGSKLWLQITWIRVLFQVEITR